MYVVIYNFVSETIIIIISTDYGSPLWAIIEYLNTRSGQLKAPFITQYSKDNWIDVAEYLSGPAEPLEDAGPKATWNKKKVYPRFQLLRSLRNNSNYTNGLKIDHPYELWKKLMDTH